jgi:hypothetical protein
VPAYPTHSFFSHLALQALIDARHPLAGAASRHEALFRIAGIAGCDIQCMPYQVCTHCEAPYRHDQKENRTCLVCHREALKDFSFKVSDGRKLTRRDVERDLYGNTHLVLYRQYQGYGVPRNVAAGSAEQPFPNQVIRHLANTLRDAEKVAGRKRAENYLAFTLGWFSHVVSDAIFKGVYPHAAKVNFFGEQYGMKMLPAAETLTMTDISHDFGVSWPAWHEQLPRAETDGGALKHLTMGDPAERYDEQYWTAEFGKPDPAIGRVVDAVQPLNRKWFRQMYVQPDYSAPSPRLDAAPLSTRATWKFGTGSLDLGQLHHYALTTGWYDSFVKGVAIYLRVVEASTQLANIKASADSRPPESARAGLPSWTLWQGIVSESLRSPAPREPDFGSRLDIDPQAAPFLRSLRNRSVRIVLGPESTDYQQSLANALRRTLGVRSSSRASIVIVVGPASFNPAARELLCIEDTLRFKYIHGCAGVIRVSAAGEAVLLAGLSDFGDHLIAKWLRTI